VNVVSGDIVTVDITPDANPTQTSWKLFDSTNAIVAQGTSNDATVCISDNCHRFEIYDTGNNGLNASGNYKIYLNGLEVANGQAFTSLDIRYVNCPDGISCDNAIVASLGTLDVPFDNTWYVFTPASNGQYKISTCSLASCDTKIWVYDYCTMANFDDSNEASYTYNDDFCGIQAESNVFMTGGDTYYIRVGSIGQCSGQSYQALFEYTGAITGCMDINACNFNPLAGIAGTCYYNGDPNCTGLGPDLEVSLPDLYSTLYSTTVNGTDGCLVNEGCLQGLGTRSVLRFTTRITNIGTQDYFIGVPNAGNPQFEYDACHNHYHYEGYAEYLLFNQAGEPMPQIGFKNGFCVLDLSCPSGISAQYSCGNMGITAGCADYYSSGLSCQWIDVTDVPSGDYYLVVRTNWDQSPDKNGRYELRYDNNWAQVCIHFDKDANNNLINFTKNIATCPILEDCLGVPFGDTYPDCEGTCPGVVIKGDVNQDGYFTMIDEHTYAEAAVYGGVAVSPCTDLNNDGEITVADAAYAGACIHQQQDLGVPPLLYTECPYDDEILDANESATLGVMNLNTTESYFDLYIINPDNEISALQVDFSGVVLSSVENLLSNAVWNAHIHPEVGGNSLAVLGDGPTYIPINIAPTPILRVHYSSLTANTVCVNNIIDILNDFNHNIITVYGDCQSVIPNIVADFSANSTSVCSGQSVDFTDLSAGGATSWLWSFPGGTPTSSTSQNPTVTYNSGGTYSVTLTATGPQGNDQEIKTNYIQVGSAVAWYYDGDNDGFGNNNITVFACVAPLQFVAVNGDCNDGNASVHPGAIEVCNNVDDDCDNSIDEGFDADGDGFTTCEGDCNDNNALAYPGAFELCNGVDDDCDNGIDEGYDLDGDGYTVCAGDCNDNNSSAYPGAPEICNGIDDDCDNSIDEGYDTDGDGYTSCSGDCNDNNANVHPGATEICNNIDDDCDNSIDEGFDTDGDGYTTCNGDCDDNNSSLFPEANEICNNIDDDCDNLIDEGFDNDGDGYTSCNGDCDDNNSSLFPGATEICNNIDDDCDGSIDEGFDLDGDGYTTCEGDCNDNNNAVHPGAIEVCNNFDDDCDNLVDENTSTACAICINGQLIGTIATWYQDIDNDGFGNASISQETCTQPSGYVSVSGDCNDNNASVHPGATEICNGIDDDCDNSIDEGFDADNDGFASCGGDCNDSNASIHPGATEICNGIDDDCDNAIDEGVGQTWYADIDGDGYGNPNSFVSACTQPSGHVLQAGDCNDNNNAINPAAIEICFNGIDEDCDGTADDGCPAVANDWKQYASPLNVSAYNTCNATSGNISLASASAESQSSALTGQDLWYSFTPVSPGVQIKVTTSSFNALVELQNNSGVMIDNENLQSANGNEFLNIGNLTPGQQYFVAVRNFNSAQGTGTFTICVSDLPSTGCLTPAAAYNMCSKFKAVVVNATNYVYNFTSTQTNITYSRTQPSSILDLYKVMNMPTGSNYVARVDASYTVTRGNGTSETIVVQGSSTCTFSFNADPLLILATTQDCPSPRPLGVNIRSNTTVCYSLNYQWEFQKADLSEPVFTFNGGTTQYLMITSAMGFVPGTTYNVRVRVTYQSGYTNPWGPVSCLLIAGSGGMIEYLDGESNEHDFDRNETGISMNLYPNPIDGNSVNLEVTGIESGLVNATLTDGLGKMIENRQFYVEGYLLTTWIFENKLSSGIYLLDIYHDGKRVTERIVVE
ncbi:MAG: MopE-related protein, partial [Flavobacteriales bacterium]